MGLFLIVEKEIFEKRMSELKETNAQEVHIVMYIRKGVTLQQAVDDSIEDDDGDTMYIGLGEVKTQTKTTYKVV